MKGDHFMDDEVDASTIFRQEATELTTVRSLDDTLDRFGFSLDDRINRRELVLIYRKVEKEMEAEIYRLAHIQRYDDAKEMRARLTNLRAAFDNLQTSVVKVSHQDQNEFFDKASQELMQNVEAMHEQQKVALDTDIDFKRTDLKRFHEIQWENLELAISRIVKPRMKYSKRAIELFKAEDELIKLCQYEDARKVRRLIDHICPGEVKRFDDNFEASLEARRQKLRDAQAKDLAKNEELSLAATWKDIRRRDSEKSVNLQRIKNHQKDMSHSHILEKKLKPEMSIKPSALWQKRDGHQATAAALRGHQLLGSVRGHKEGEQVFADTLVDKHDFFDSLQDTITLHSRNP